MTMLEVFIMAELFEIIMIVLFGLSWPMNVAKSIKSKTAKGKSIAFLSFIFIGYIFGIGAKLISGNFKWYVLFFYVLNLIMVAMDMILYFINLRRDRRSSK